MRIVELKKKDSELRSECFGQGIADASDGKLFTRPTQMKPDPNKRSLIIGLGGSGIKTVNQIKTVLIAKCADFSSRVSFLAIDTDANDILRSTTALSPNETHVITNEGGDINAYYKGTRRSSFIDSWCTNQVPAMQDLTLDGANQKRQISKMKIFYPSDITSPNDKKLMETIKNAINRAIQGWTADEKLQIFIILGVSGGTGSGGIVDIAQLVRRVAPVGRTDVIGVFYMPDAMPIYDDSIKANGYAALKELDYYVCARQRDDGDELYVNPMSDGERPMIVRKGKPLYDIPILVSGSADGTGLAKDKYPETRRTATEFVVNLLAESESNRNEAAGDNQFLLKSFLSNKETTRTTTFLPHMYDPQTNQEMGEMFGEDCFDYCAIGVSTVAIPEQIIMAYAVEEIVKSLLGNSSRFVANDFKGFDLSPMGKVQGAGAIGQILMSGKTVGNKIGSLCKLTRPEDVTLDIDDIRGGGADEQFRRALRVTEVKRRAITEVDKWLSDEVNGFIDRAKQYMIEHGPQSFVMLCKGVDSEKTNYDGLLARLEKIGDTEDRTANVKRAESEVEKTQLKLKGFTGTVRNAFGKHVETWHRQFITQESARIEEAVSAHLFGADHAFNIYFRDPVKRFIDACEDFSEALDELRDVYTELGDGFDTLEKFRATAQKNEPINVNVLNGKTKYDWAKKLVDDNIRSVNFQSLKESLIQNFIDNRRAWTDYDPKRPLSSPRRQFDELVAGVFTLESLTLAQYFTQCITNPVTESEKIITQLIDRARPRYHENGNGLGMEANVYLLVPAQLFSGRPELMESFEQSCRKHGVEMYLSHVQDKIICYRFKCALPIYALAQIEIWATAYETVNPDLDKLLHTNTGTSAEFSKEAGVPWADRPPVAYQHDVRLPRNSGQISREGRYFREVIDPFFQEALETGLIQPVQTGMAPNETYTYECFILDQDGWDYSFDAAEYARMSGAVADGKLLKGRAIAEYFAEKNHVSKDACVRPIRLLDSCGFEKPMPKLIAEDRAKRVIRKNVPLFIHLKRSMAVMRSVSEIIDETNKSSLSMQLIPTFAKSLALDILREDEKHFWKIHLGGKPVSLCRMIGASFESGSDAVFFEKGFRAKLLFDAFIGQPATVLRDVTEAVNDIWQPLVDNDAPVQQDYIDFLQWAKDEADTQIDAYFVDGRAMARRQLFRELHLEDEADMMTEKIKTLYEGIRRIYKNLQEMK